eukprot:jgi/Hompol1/547/HPOL_005001-RA
MSKKERIAANRRIIAEDPEWNLAPVERLSNLCVRVIVTNFEKKPILKGIPEKYRDRIIAAVSIDIPISIAAPLIPDESYWQRRAKTQFKLANVQEHGGSWKRLYFELYMRDRIETFVPKIDTNGTTGDKNGANESLAALLAEIRLGAPFIEQLDVRQLKPAEFWVEHGSGSGAANPTTAAQAGADMHPNNHATKDLSKAIDEHPDHLDLSLVLNELTNLKNFSVYYGVKDIGINFSWTYFGMTLNDSMRISSALKKSQLNRLVIKASAIDDDRCRLMCHALLSNTTLSFLDLSHNKIGDAGARGLAKVLATPSTSLKELLLSNNKITHTGSISLGKALSLNTSLSSLNLRLNHLGDAGGHTLCTALMKNKTLKEVDLSGNGLGTKAVTALCALLRKNGRALVSLDVSCNKLGNYGHTVAMEHAGGTAQGTQTLGAATAAAPIVPSFSIKEIGLFGATHGNIDGDLAGKMIFEAISQNKYLTKLDLRMTDLSPEFLIAIQGIVNENGMA